MPKAPKRSVQHLSTVYRALRREIRLVYYMHYPLCFNCHAAQDRVVLHHPAQGIIALRDTLNSSDLS